MKRLFSVLALGAITFVAGCVSPPPRANDPYYAPVLPRTPLPAAANNGSIYQAGHCLVLVTEMGGQYPGLPVPDQFGAKSRKIARGIAPGKHIQRGVKNTSWQIFPRCGTAYAGVPFVYL